MPTIIPIPAPLKPRSSVYDLKKRLDWGEPALTIVDIRVRKDYNSKRISGAISMPTDELLDMASVSLDIERDIYIYGNTDEQATDAANLLREAGYQNVALLVGGVPAWQVASGAIEGSYATAA